HYADQLTAVGFGLLGACFLGGLLQVWAGGATGATGAEAMRRAAIGAGALATYTTVLQSLLVGVNVLTAQMIRHPLVVDGLDKAFGESLTVAAVTGGVSLGLAIGAALVVLYFVAALFVLKIGLTALLAVSVVAGALVWGVYPLPQAQWLARAWTSGLAAALAVPIAWACVFAAAALLARDTLVFDGGGQFNAPLGETLGYLVKPFAAVACFWIAYRAPYFLMGVARTAGLSSAVFRGGAAGGRGGGGGGAATRASRGVTRATDRFRAFFVTPAPRAAAQATRHARSSAASSRTRARTGGTSAPLASAPAVGSPTNASKPRGSGPAARGGGGPTGDPKPGSSATRRAGPGDAKPPNRPAAPSAPRGRAPGAAPPARDPQTGSRRKPRPKTPPKPAASRSASAPATKKPGSPTGPAPASRPAPRPNAKPPATPPRPQPPKRKPPRSS
ncbi:MAG TPA: hypothetical protein VGV67_10420, partial [Solirubrobacteraceae bacterium]|nr:hypothetical protein [Solirubrobacteraceae bacterium]